MLRSSLFTFIRTFAPALQARWSLRLSAKDERFSFSKEEFDSPRDYYRKPPSAQ